MSTLLLSYFFIISSTSCYAVFNNSSPTANITKTDDAYNGTVEIILNNKTALCHDRVELVCEINPKDAALTTVWMKGRKIITENRRVKLDGQKIIINDTVESDAGFYTCRVKTPFGTQNRTAFLTVMESEEEDDGPDGDDQVGDYSGEEEEPNSCGTPNKKELSQCDQSEPATFANCKSLAPAVKASDIKIHQQFHSSSNTPTLKLKVEWKVPAEGNSTIWGWQIIIADILRYPGVYRCEQVNKKYTLYEHGYPYVRRTFSDIKPGTTLKITIKSLPSADETTVVEKIKDYCDEFPRSPCCYKAKDIVMKQKKSTCAVLSWPDLTSPNSSLRSKTFLSGFVVRYNSTNASGLCHKGELVKSLQDALNNSHIMFDKLRPSCENYTFEVTPLFTEAGCRRCNDVCDLSSKEGKSSELYVLQMQTMVQTSETNQSKKLDTAWLTAVVAVLAVLIVIICLSVVLIFCKRKRGVERPEEKAMILKEKKVTEIFIACASHCKDCEAAVLSVASYLNMTGHCKCFLDLCSLPKEWSSSMAKYFESQIAKCQKVIVLFTVSGSIESEDDPRVRDSTTKNNFILQELLGNCPTTQFVPAYVDYLSNRDIPPFLRHKESFSLPSQLPDLVLHVMEQTGSRPESIQPMRALENDAKLTKQQKIVEAKIKDLNVQHMKKLKRKNNNTVAQMV